MAKSNLLTETNIVACPHCRAPIGKVVDGELSLGFVSLHGNFAHTMKCNDCGQEFTYRPPSAAPPPKRQVKPMRGHSQPF